MQKNYLSKWSKRLSLVLVSSLVLMLASCGEKDSPKPKPNPTPPSGGNSYTEAQTSKKDYKRVGKDELVDLKDNVILVRKDINDQLISNKEDEIVYNDSPEMQLVKEGDILFSSGIEDPSKAYAYKVVGIEKKNGALHYKVEQARIDEVVEDYKQNFDVVPRVEQTEIYDWDYQLEQMRAASLRGEEFRAMEGTVPLDQRGRVKFEYKDETCFLNMVVADGDGNYKTTNDQLHLKLGIKIEEKEDLVLSFEDKHLIFNGSLELNAISELVYAYEDGKEEELKKKRQIPNSIRRQFTRLVDKKIKLVSIKMLPPMITDCVAELKFDVYLVFGLGIDGSLKVHTEYGPFYANFDYERTMLSVKKEEFDIDGSQAGLHDMSVKGEVKVDGKLGLAIGPALHFPAFRNKKAKSDSYFALLTDIVAEISAEASAELKKDRFSTNTSDLSGSIVSSLSMGLNYKPYFEGKFYLWGRKIDLGGDVPGFEEAKPLFQPWKFDFAWLWLRENQDMEVDFHLNKSSLPRMAVNKLGIVNASWNNEGKAVITGVKNGSTTIDLAAPNNVRRSGKVWTYVHKAKFQLPGNANYPAEDKVFVEGGSFQMGSNDGNNLEKPIHQVTVPSFYIGKYEVTNQQYADFLNAKGNQSEGGVTWLDINDSDCQIIQKNSVFKPKSGKENYPVIEVTWYGAKAYAEWVGGRLLSEAEWEYAARGGNKSKGYKYSGSNNIDDVAWYSSNSQNADNNIRRGKGTHQVGTKQANELGIYDMSGNVSEWCQDTWHSNYTNAPADGSAWLKNGNDSNRVVRGGAWFSGVEYCRVARRVLSDARNDDGIRVCWDAK